MWYDTFDSCLLLNPFSAYAYSDPWWQILVCLTVRTMILNAPQDVYFVLGVTELRFQCEASSDASTPVTITWKKDNEPVNTYRWFTITSRELIINTVGLSLYYAVTSFIGDYTCEATNGYSYAKAKAALKYGK